MEEVQRRAASLSTTLDAPWSKVFPVSCVPPVVAALIVADHFECSKETEHALSVLDKDEESASSLALSGALFSLGR